MTMDTSTTTTVDTDTTTTQHMDDVDCQDVLLELYWYLKHKRSARIDGSKQQQHQQQPHGATAAEVDDQTENNNNNMMMMTLDDIIWCLEQEGIWFWRDPRFYESQKVALTWISTTTTTFSTTSSSSEQPHDDEKDHVQKQETVVGKIHVSFTLFSKLVTPCARLFLSCFNEQLVIPDWSSFASDLEYFFDQCKDDTSGQTAQYIPILRDADPNKWGVAVCSVDGQRTSMGDASTAKFTLQSVSKPVTYAIGLTKEGDEFMESYIDVEPAGRPFNTQDLDPTTNRPFNASVNSGAIMSAGVVASGYPPDVDWKHIVDQVRLTWMELCGEKEEEEELSSSSSMNTNAAVGFSDETYVSEKATAYNNYAIAYNLKGRRGLPRDVDLHKMLEVYLGCCSIEITAEALSVAAATLANGGICPITEKEVFPSHVVRSVLAETMTCGMYDQAGKFAVEVGCPSKSGVSGALCIMIPNLCGIATFSPRLNAKGNSVRGIAFCKRLVNSYRIHMFEPLHGGRTGSKIDPRQNGWKNEQQKVSLLAWAASVGDDEACRVRRIFLAVLFITSTASQEGLSDRRIKLIKQAHQQVFLTDVSETLFDDVLEHVKQGTTKLSYLEGLIAETPMMDVITDIIFSAMIEIATSLGTPIDPHEREVGIQIASMTLGMNDEVAELELKRYGKRIGHRFETQEIPDMIENVRTTVCGPYKNLPGNTFSSLVSLDSLKNDDKDSVGRSLTDRSSSETTDTIIDEPAGTATEPTTIHNDRTQSVEPHQREESFRMRKQILNLKQRLSLLRRNLMGRTDNRNKG